jgi:hypothetical protein
MRDENSISIPNHLVDVKCSILTHQYMLSYFTCGLNIIMSIILPSRLYEYEYEYFIFVTRIQECPAQKAYESHNLYIELLCLVN